MVIELSKSFEHSSCQTSNQNYSEKELQNIILDLMKKNGISTDTVQVGEGTLKIESLSTLNMHTLMLQAEEMGLNLKLRKKTIIEVC